MCSVCDFFLINTLLQQQKQKKITFVTKKKINPTLALTLPNLNNLAVLTLKM